MKAVFIGHYLSDPLMDSSDFGIKRYVYIRSSVHIFLKNSTSINGRSIYNTVRPFCIVGSFNSYGETVWRGEVPSPLLGLHVSRYRSLIFTRCGRLHDAAEN